ncbi:PREDICTED: uncharacterized protein LOC105124128 [Populus euphratica]|uniref:Uncharacterized protein LOC105124128 n=1 Tax=Populus euphratica TaxID=75702 RepID=A0AAJ6U4A7_POPEU|nr:PREDICTED: uncharacterized protein LOC105124128 [Populus euphratica]
MIKRRIGIPLLKVQFRVLLLLQTMPSTANNQETGRMLFKAASFNCTIWTADCNPNSSQAVIGTNLGAALVNLETGMASWVCRSKCDVLSQQLDPSGNVVLCGLINGAILTVDVREKQERVSDRLNKAYNTLFITGQTRSQF